MAYFRMQSLDSNIENDGFRLHYDPAVYNIDYSVGYTDGDTFAAPIADIKAKRAKLSLAFTLSDVGVAISDLGRPGGEKRQSVGEVIQRLVRWATPFEQLQSTIVDNQVEITPFLQSIVGAELSSRATIIRPRDDNNPYGQELSTTDIQNLTPDSEIELEIPGVRGSDLHYHRIRFGNKERDRYFKFRTGQSTNPLHRVMVVGAHGRLLEAPFVGHIVAIRENVTKVNENGFPIRANISVDIIEDPDSAKIATRFATRREYDGQTMAARDGGGGGEGSSGSSSWEDWLGLGLLAGGLVIGGVAYSKFKRGSKIFGGGVNAPRTPPRGSPASASGPIRPKVTILDDATERLYRAAYGVNNPRSTSWHFHFSDPPEVPIHIRGLLDSGLDTKGLPPPSGLRPPNKQALSPLFSALQRDAVPQPNMDIISARTLFVRKPHESLPAITGTEIRVLNRSASDQLRRIRESSSRILPTTIRETPEGFGGILVHRAPEKVTENKYGIIVRTAKDAAEQRQYEQLWLDANVARIKAHSKPPTSVVSESGSFVERPLSSSRDLDSLFMNSMRVSYPNSRRIRAGEPVVWDDAIDQVRAASLSVKYPSIKLINPEGNAEAPIGLRTMLLDNSVKVMEPTSTIIERGAPVGGDIVPRSVSGERSLDNLFIRSLGVKYPESKTILTGNTGIQPYGVLDHLAGYSRGVRNPTSKTIETGSSIGVLPELQWNSMMVRDPTSKTIETGSSIGVLPELQWNSMMVRDPTSKTIETGGRVWPADIESLRENSMRIGTQSWIRALDPIANTKIDRNLLQSFRGNVARWGIENKLGIRSRTNLANTQLKIIEGQGSIRRISIDRFEE